MIIQNEKFYRKRKGIYNCYYKRTSYMLFGIIPLYVKNILVSYDISCFR